MKKGGHCAALLFGWVGLASCWPIHIDWQPHPIVYLFVRICN